MYPDDAVARELFGRVGKAVVPEEEWTLEAFSAATATFAAHLDYLATIAKWLAEHGVESGVANDYVTHVFGELGKSLRHAELAAMTEEHMTPGGINEQFLGDLRRDGMPDMVRTALDRILERLRN